MGEALSVVIPFTHQDNTAACGFDVPMIRESLAVKRFSRHISVLKSGFNLDVPAQSPGCVHRMIKLRSSIDTEDI